MHCNSVSRRLHVHITKHIPLGNEQDSLEFELTLDRKVLDSEMVFPVVRQALVKRRILLLRDILRVASPDRLRLVELLVGRLLLLDLLRLLLLGLVLVVLDFLDLGLLLALLSDLLLLVILDFL